MAMSYRTEHLVSVAPEFTWSETRFYTKKRVSVSFLKADNIQESSTADPKTKVFFDHLYYIAA